MNIVLTLMITFVAVSCHPLMPANRYETIPKQSKQWRGLNSDNIYITNQPIAIAHNHLDIHQDTHFATELLEKNMRLRILTLTKIVSLNGTSYSAKCQILSGKYQGSQMNVSYTKDFYSQLRSAGS